MLKLSNTLPKQGEENGSQELVPAYPPLPYLLLPHGTALPAESYRRFARASVRRRSLRRALTNNATQHHAHVTLGREVPIDGPRDFRLYFDS
jgi:hypothetical protein